MKMDTIIITHGAFLILMKAYRMTIQVFLFNYINNCEEAEILWNMNNWNSLILADV
jgi:hypothetical protein